ncbi:hypothetical protein H3U96_08225 [Gilliamella sp. M0364]|nr:hypothetical protein [Gilliamella sp. M0364]
MEIYYNRIRRHSGNGWISPEQYEQHDKIIEAGNV